MYLIDFSGMRDSKLLAVGKYDREDGKVGVLRVYYCKNRNAEPVFLTGVIL